MLFNFINFFLILGINIDYFRLIFFYLFFKLFNILIYIFNYAKRKPNIEIQNNIKFNENQNNQNLLKIGRGGILIPTGNTLYEIETFVDFQINFISGTKLEGIGKVLWNGNINEQGEYCAGIEFRYLNDATRNHAIEILEKCNSLEYIPERKNKFEN